MTISNIKGAIAAALMLFAAIPTLDAADSITFEDITHKTGITFKHTDGASGQYYLIEAMASGLALFDYNNDGLIDIFFLNGCALKGAHDEKPPYPALYRNEGDGTFTDVTENAGLARVSFGLGVTVGDYDNDGNLDLYINNFGSNILYHNNGDGTFTDVTARTGTADSPTHTGSGACFLDIDGDGNLDLFSSHYIAFSYAAHKLEKVGDYGVYPAPHMYPSDTNVLYRNNGDGTFSDVSVASGISAYVGSGMGAICCDYDHDGATDIFVANDSDQNFLFKNDGHGKFEQVGLTSGIAYDLFGKANGNMGMEMADYDNDGNLDLFITSFAMESVMLFRNLGHGMFEDVTRLTAAGAGTLPKVKWGEGFVDFDNDGFKDLFVACGNLQVNIEKYDDRYTYLQKHTILKNNGHGKFVNVSDRAGDALQVPHTGRGTGFDDLDNDGRVDAVILNSRSTPTVLRNTTADAGHWLQVHLRGTKTNRDGIGATVKVISGELVLIDEVHSGRNYQSHSGMRLYFGLGDHKTVDRVEVKWIGGGTDTYSKVPIDTLVHLVEGRNSVQ